MRKRNASMRRISRMDYDKCGKGWWVRITKGSDVIAHGMFRDRKHGGKEGALIAAKRWRDIAERHIWGKIRPYTYGQPFRDLIQVNNKSGKTGVFYSVGRFKKGYTYPFWAATWSIKCKNNIKRFYVHHFSSSKKTREAAVRFRLDVEGKLKRGR
ncbi:hypothetical protein ES703_115089 [subsurface metagenome]